jgi:hypothetical protein
MNLARGGAWVRSAALGLALGAGACSGYRDVLLRRAAFDLNCSEENLVMHDLGSRTRGVAGCGRRATYVERCEPPYGYVGHHYVVGSCGWVMDSQSADGERAGLPAPTNTPATIQTPAPIGTPAPATLSEPAPASTVAPPAPAPEAATPAPATTEPAAAP